MSAKPPQINEAIRASELRVIDEGGRRLGVLSKAEALQAAQEADLDIIMVSPEANPPVAKIVDWGKYNYQRTKQLQKNRQKARSLDMKQMRVGLKISDHDLDIKLRKVTAFLDVGHKVKIAVIYRGRERSEERR